VTGQHLNNSECLTKGQTISTNISLLKCSFPYTNTTSISIFSSFKKCSFLKFKVKIIKLIFQDGTIGDDLVVKPLPSQIRSQILEGNLEHSESIAQPTYANPFDYEGDFFVGDETRHTNETDDYEFLDEEDKFVDKVSISSNLKNDL
jgi:hypothetical protein